jgi:hypothetical protein
MTQEMVDCDTPNLWDSARWEHSSLANVATSTHSLRLKLRETWFIMTKTCDFLQIASKAIQIIIQFDQEGQPFRVGVHTLSFSMTFLRINKQRQAITSILVFARTF